MPLFMRWPGAIAEGSVFQPVVSLIDLFPTIMHAIGGTVKHTIDGINLLPYMLTAQGKLHQHTVGSALDKTLATDRKREDLLSQLQLDKNVTDDPNSAHFTDDDCAGAGAGAGTSASTADDWAIDTVHNHLFWRSGHYSALRKGYWKIQKSANPDMLWLYNLEDDEGERTNLAYDEQYQERLQIMLRTLQEEHDKQKDPNWASVSQTPFLLDKIWGEQYVEGDEYIYFPN